MESLKERTQDALTDIRRVIGCTVVYTELYVRTRCELAYGRAVSDRTWLRWQRKVRAEADPAELCGVSEATYLLLFTLASLLKGNGTSRRNQVPLARLTKAVEIILQRARPYDLPDIVPYADLHRLVELRSLRTYTDRYHRLQGLKKSKPVYSKKEATEILSKYPDYSHVYAEAI